MARTRMAPESELPDAPQRLGRYEVLLPIGRGGMASVYLGRVEVVEGTYRQVAIKVMHPHFDDEAGEGARALLEEARLAARIHHPNVVRVEEAARDPRGVFLAMEYVEGETLSGLIRAAKAAGTRISVTVLARILSDALEGLHAVHELCDERGVPLRVIHRDFSPSNILVGLDGTTRLSDFGIAKAESQVHRTATGQVKGKIAYMAPEQIMGRPLDRRCDVWAAGVVLWECFAARRLHPQEDEVATMFRIVQTTPPRLDTVVPDANGALVSLVASALEPRIERRCASADALQRGLHAAVAEQGGIADRREVAAQVEALVGRKAQKRREQLAHVVQLRGQIARVSRSASHLAMGEGTTPPSITVDPMPPSPVDEVTATQLLPTRSADTTETTSALRLDGPRRRSRVVVAAAIAMAAALGVAAAITLVRASAPSPTPADASPADRSAAAPPRRVVLTANADIASLRLDDKTIALARPTSSLDLDVSAFAHGASIEAVASDTSGRTTTIDIAPGDTALALRFEGPVPMPTASAAVASASTPPPLARPPARAGRGSSPRPAGDPGLAPPPYERRP